MSVKYQKIGESEADFDQVGTEVVDIDDEESNIKATENSNTNNLDGNEYISLKILCYEASYEITDLKSQTLIADFKKRIEIVAKIPASRQRLIHNGKPLKPDDKPLTFFKVMNRSSIHLFPLPIAKPSNESNMSTTAIQVSASPLHIESTNNIQSTIFPLDNDRNSTVPSLYDPSFSQTVREVKLWSTTLLFLSCLSLFNLLTFVSDKQQFGKGYLDFIVRLMDFACSMGGIYVGNYGINSVRTMDIMDINKYVKWLGRLAVVCVIYRLLWVVDVVLLAKFDGDKDINNEPPADSSTTGDEKNNDPTNDFVSYAMQASLIGLICLFAWLTCYLRALRFQAAMQTPIHSARPVEI